MSDFDTGGAADPDIVDPPNAETANIDENQQVGDEDSGDRDATYRVQGDESVSEAVVRAVSTESRVDRTKLKPLYSVVDPDALNALFTASETGGSRRTSGHVAFDYAGYGVRVTDDRILEVSSLG